MSTKHLLCQVSISLIAFIPVASWTEYLKNKLFCRNGTVDDILLGFKNLAGNYGFVVYLFNSLSIEFICKLVAYVQHSISHRIFL